MSNSYFKFKQFTINQEMCGMKVGTDGVLLGAWANLTNSSKILDIGTGTGLVALMSAQRTLNSSIDAIDIDKGAYMQALLNFQDSKFNDRLNVYHVSLQDFVTNSAEKYSNIVCNPPFFKDSLKPSDKQRSLARHEDSLPLEQLLSLSYDISLDNAVMSLIIPFERLIDFFKIQELSLWNISRKTIVFPRANLQAKRVLIELVKDMSKKMEESSIVIEEDRHIYTKGFTELVKPFYLYL